MQEENRETTARLRCNAAMGWTRWGGPSGPGGSIPVGPIPDSLTGEDEVAYISRLLVSSVPATGSPVWRYREKLADEERAKISHGRSVAKRAVWDSFPLDVFAGAVIGLLLGLIGAAAGDQTWLHFPLACVTMVAALAVAAEWYRRHNLGPEKERIRSAWTMGFGSVSVLAILAVVWAVGHHSRGTLTVAPSDPLVAVLDKSFYVLGSATDSKDQLIVKVPLNNTTGHNISFAAYGVAVTRPIAKNDAEEAGVFRYLKREAERLAKIGGAGISTINATSSADPGISIPGPYLHGHEWDDVESGREYVYWYALFVPSENGTDFGACGLFDAHQRLACYLGTD